MNQRTRLGELIESQQTHLGITDEGLGETVGYKPGVIAMIKNSSMRLPINKVAAFASALKMPYSMLLKAVLLESSPELWAAIEPLTPLGELSRTEINLLQHLRQLAKGATASPW